MQVVDRILADFIVVAEAWEQQARDRVAFAASDPLAEALQHCAQTLRMAVKHAHNQADLVSVAELAELHSVSRQTVHNWIKKGLVEAFAAEGGLQIPRTAILERGK